MATQAQMTDEQFDEYVLSVLSRELDVAALARFVRTYRQGQGNFTEERRAWLSQLAMEDYAQGIRDLDAKRRRR